MAEARRRDDDAWPTRWHEDRWRMSPRFHGAPLKNDTLTSVRKGEEKVERLSKAGNCAEAGKL